MNKLEIFEDVDLLEIVEKYGTPLYVMSEDLIKRRLELIKSEFLDKYENTEAVYASKAFLTKEMARILKKHSIGMDVVSGGELYTALKVDFPMEKVIFHGNNKSIDELNLAIKNNIGRVVIDNIDELDIINTIAEEHNKVINVLLRVTPGVDSDTHEYIKTSQFDSKFGIPIDNESIDATFDSIRRLNNLCYKGLHFHIGSQLHNNESHIKAVNIMIDLISDILDKHGYITEELNTGGGYGIDYSGEGSIDIQYFTDKIMDAVIEKCEEKKINRPKIIIEPGRWIVGEAGITLYKVGYVKEIPNIRTYVSVDGGMTDNIRPSLYQAKYDGAIINKLDENNTKLVTIAGKCCETGDLLIKDLYVPSSISRGDILAIFSTGAYNYSMASNYNKVPKPAVVMVNNGKERLIVKRESYEDILKNEI